MGEEMIDLKKISDKIREMEVDLEKSMFFTLGVQWASEEIKTQQCAECVFVHDNNCPSVNFRCICDRWEERK